MSLLQKEERNTRSHRLNLVSDKMEMEALNLEQQIAILERAIETFKVLENQGADAKARVKLEEMVKAMKEDVKYLDQVIKSLNKFI